MSKQIKAVWMPEPPRQGEYPASFAVGQLAHVSGRNVIPTRIVAITGDDDIAWFDIYADIAGKEELIVSINQRYVAEVH